MSKTHGKHIKKRLRVVSFPRRGGASVAKPRNTLPVVDSTPTTTVGETGVRFRPSPYDSDGGKGLGFGRADATNTSTSMAHRQSTVSHHTFGGLEARHRGAVELNLHPAPIRMPVEWSSACARRKVVEGETKKKYRGQRQRPKTEAKVRCG